MADSAVLERPSAKGKHRKPPTRGWWGDGPSPSEQWPGTTIDLPAIWTGSRWESPCGRYFYDAKAADRVVEFFPTYLRHYLGHFVGEPFILLPYQEWLIVRPIFGWKHAHQTEGRYLRRFRKLFGFLPKGAGKSPLGSGLGFYLAFCDGEAGAEVYAVASEKNQARIVHDNARIMAETIKRLDPEMGALLLVKRDEIEREDTHSKFIVISADAASKHGYRPSAVVMDEMHAQKNRHLYEVLWRSMIKRLQPLMLILTHAGHDDEGICVAPDTKLLTSDLRWVRAGDVAVGDILAGFDEHSQWPGHRRWQKSAVLEATTAMLPSYEITLSDGTNVVCSEDHMWLVQTAGRRAVWRKTKDLTDTDRFFKPVDVWLEDQSRGAGYLAGLFDGEGHLSSTTRAKCLCGFTQRVNGTSELGQALLTERGFRWAVYGGEANGRSARQTMITRKRDILRFLGSIRPARLLEKFERIAYGPTGLRFKSRTHPTVASKTFVGLRKVVALKTSTHTYVAEGLASHNCFEEYDYAKRIVSGTVEEPAVLPVIFEATAEDDPFSEVTWRKVNPGHGVTVQHDAIVALAREAEAEPRKRNDFLMWHLNRWVNQATAWIPVDWWDACDTPIASDAELAQVPCAGGLDLAQKIDLASLVVVFRHRLEEAVTVDVKADGEDGAVVTRQATLNYRLTAIPFFWIPENTMRERERQDGVPYSEWVRLGLVTPTEGDIIDYQRIYTDITTKIIPRFPRLKQGGIGYDPAFATDIASSLRDKAGCKVEEILQNYKYMSEPCYVLEAIIKAKRIAHGGHRVFRNHIEHVAIKRDDAGRIRPVKPKKAGKHIDGVVATLMAQRMLAAVPDQHAVRVGGFFV